MDNYSFLGAANTAFFEEIYEQYLKEPDSVESSWRSFFQGYDFANESYSEDELEARLEARTLPEAKEKRGVLAKYAKLVSSASLGAITDGF